jgi:hypothetical protein
MRNQSKAIDSLSERSERSAASSKKTSPGAHSLRLCPVVSSLNNEEKIFRVRILSRRT